jgi:hypothetical protein
MLAAKKIANWTVGLGLLYYVAVDRYDKASKLVEVPSKIGDTISKMLPEWSTNDLMLVGVALACIAWATSDRWMPWIAQFFAPPSLASALSGANAPPLSREEAEMNNGDRNVNVHGPNYGPINTGDVNVNQAPDPQLRFLDERSETRADGTFKKTFVVEIVAPYPVPRFTVQAQAQDIIDVTVFQLPNGGSKSAVRKMAGDGHMTESFGPAHGQFQIDVITRTDQAVRIAHAWRDV